MLLLYWYIFYIHVFQIWIQLVIDCITHYVNIISCIPSVENEINFELNWIEPTWPISYLHHFNLISMHPFSVMVTQFCLQLTPISFSLLKFAHRQLRVRRALSILKDIPLRTRRAVSLYKVYGDSALLVLNGTSFNSDSALLVLNWRHGQASSIQLEC